MQNQQTQQDLPNNTKPFFTTGQGTNSSNVNQFESKNNLNTTNRYIDWQQRRNKIPGQIGGAAIGGAAIDGAVTGASQAESPVPGAQEPLDVQTLPNAIDNATQERVLNPEIGGMNTETTNIIPFPSRDSQAQKTEQKTEDQTTTDGVNKIVPFNDALNRKDLPVIEKLAKEVGENPAEAYGLIVKLRRDFSNQIRRIGENAA